MSANFAETIGELRELLADMRNESQQTSYGFFLGGDPRRFSPDEEMCSPEELALHKADCARAERGEPLEGAAGSDRVRGSGKPGYGMGTTACEDEQLVDWCERLERYIAQLEGVALVEAEIA